MVPGECWAFEGSVGDVVIKLAVPSIVTGFTLEHIPKIVSRYDHIDSAPKHFQVLVSCCLKKSYLAIMGGVIKSLT